MDTADALIAFCNCGNKSEAQSLAHWLLDHHLAACVNILPAVESVYRWQGKIETEHEHTLMIKTNTAAFTQIKAELPSRHSYDVPELIAVPISDGLPAYLNWLQDSITP